MSIAHCGMCGARRDEGGSSRCVGVERVERSRFVNAPNRRARMFGVEGRNPMQGKTVRSVRAIVAGLFIVSVITTLVLAATPAGAQGLRSGEPGDLIVFIDRNDIPEGSTCTVSFENNESSHPGNVANARSSLERVVEADFEDGSGETVELTIESDGMLFAAVRLGETGGTSTSVDFTCVQTATTTTEVPSTTAAPTTTLAPTTTETPDTTAAPTTTSVPATTTEVIETEVLPQVEEREVAQLAVTGRTNQAVLGMALVAIALGMLLMGVGSLESND